MMFHWRHSRHLYGQFGKYSGHGTLRVTGMTVLGVILVEMDKKNLISMVVV